MNGSISRGLLLLLLIGMMLIFSDARQHHCTNHSQHGDCKRPHHLKRQDRSGHTTSTVKVNEAELFPLVIGARSFGLANEGTDGREHLRLKIEENARRTGGKGSLANQVYNIVVGDHSYSDWSIYKRVGDFKKFESKEWEAPNEPIDSDFRLLHTVTSNIAAADIPPLAQWNGRIIIFGEGVPLRNDNGGEVDASLARFCKDGRPSNCASAHFDYTGAELAEKVYNFILEPWGMSTNLASVDFLMSYSGFFAQDFKRALETKWGIPSEGITVRGLKYKLKQTLGNFKVDQSCIALIDEDSSSKVKCALKHGLKTFFTAKGETFACYGCLSINNVKLGSLDDAGDAFMKFDRDNR